MQMPIQNYALCCVDESQAILSNWRSLELWDSLERLITLLLKEASFSSLQTLYAWKEGGHQALSKEPYAWRTALEEIKNSDLSAKCANESRENAVLMADKPTMLKIAGEVTNALMHSYTLRHKITFIQRTSNVPS